MTEGESHGMCVSIVAFSGGLSMSQQAPPSLTENLLQLYIYSYGYNFNKLTDDSFITFMTVLCRM